jgi:hypothetical protein
MVRVKNGRVMASAFILSSIVIPSIASASLEPKSLDFPITPFYQCNTSCISSEATIEKKIRLMAMSTFLCWELINF